MGSQGLGKIGENQRTSAGILLEVRANIGHLIADVKSRNITVLLF